MDVRFVAYNRLGAKRGVLPHVLAADFVPTKNELPTLTLSYARRAVAHPYLQNQPEVALEYYNHKTEEWVEPRDARFRLQSTDLNHLEEVETRQYTFLGIGEAMRGVYIYDRLGLPVNDENKVQFGKATVGYILGKIWDGARARGWTGFARSFTDTHDSNGVAWDTKINIGLEMDNSFESTMMYLVRSGLCDFHWEGRTLHLYNNGGAARELSTGATPLRFNLSGGPTGVDSAPEMTDREGMATHVVVNGEDGLRWVFPTGATLPEGRREVFLSYAGVDEEATAKTLAMPTIIKYGNPLKNTTRQFQVSDAMTIFPLIDYRIDDWVSVEKEDGNWERMQIYTVSLTLNQNGLQGWIGLGDKIDTLLEVLNEKVQRVMGGSGTESQDKVKPSDRRPSSPKTLLVGTDTYIDHWARPVIAVHVSFTHDGLDIQGSPVSVSRFEVEYRPNGQGIWIPLFNITSPEQEGTYSPLEAYDSDGDLMKYQFRVFAYSNKNAVSPGSEVVTITARKDTTIPDKPSKPVVTTQSGIFTVVTDHKTDSGLAQQADYSHVIVEMSTAANGKPWVNVGAIQPPINKFMIGNEGYVTRWFRLIAVDTSGNRSEPSEWAEGTTTPLVDVDVILSEIDAAKTVIKNAKDILISSGITLGQNLASNKALADEAIRGLPFTSPNAPTLKGGEGRPVGATWQRLNKDGKQIGFWRWNGTEWEEMSLSPSVIPVIQIGSGTAGDLDVSRLTATEASFKEAVIQKLWVEVIRSRQIQADQVLIGQGMNLIPDPTFVKPAELYNLSNAGVGWGTYVDKGRTVIQYKRAEADGFLYPLGVAAGLTSDTTNWVPCQAEEEYVYKFTAWSVELKRWKVQMRVLLDDGTRTTIESDKGWQTTARTGSVLFKTPVGAVKMGLVIWVQVNEGGYFSIFGADHALMLKNDASLIVNGAIVTRHLTVTEDMTVALLKAHKVEAHEIDVNSLTADTGFIASLKVTLLDAEWITADAIRADAITSKFTITGATIQTDKAANRGIKLTRDMLVAYDGAGKETFRLGAYTGNVTATGAFLATGLEDISILMAAGPYKGAGGNRPRLIFDTNRGGPNALEPSIFAIGASGYNGYVPGALIMNGFEDTANSSGRAVAQLGPGQQAFFGFQHGRYNGYGFQAWSDGSVTLTGRMAYTNYSTFASAELAYTTMSGNPGSTVTWKVPNAYPRDYGKYRPQATADSMVPINYSVNNVLNTGYTITAWGQGQSGTVGMFTLAIWSG